MDLILRISKEEIPLIEAIEQEPSLETITLEGAGFDGANDLVPLLVTLTTSSLTALVTLLRTRWNRHRHVSIEVDGIKIAGADPDQIEAVLKQVLAHRNKQADPAV